MNLIIDRNRYHLDSELLLHKLNATYIRKAMRIYQFGIKHPYKAMGVNIFWICLRPDTWAAYYAIDVNLCLEFFQLFLTVGTSIA